MIGKALHLTLMALAWFIRKAFGHVRILIVVLMLGLNIVSLTVSSVGSAMGGLITMGAALVGLSDISTGWNEAKVAKKQVGTLEKQVATLKDEKASLDGNLKRTNTSLELERQTSTRLREETGKLRKEAQVLRAETQVTLKGKKVLLRDAVQEVATKVNRKSAKIAAANIASMPGEAIPVVGIAVLVASVGFEIEGTCEIMTEMHELQMAIDPSPANDLDVAEVCGMKVPTREELVSQVKRSPHVIWLGMQRTYNNLPDLPEIGLSDRLHKLLDIFN